MWMVVMLRVCACRCSSKLQAFHNLQLQLHVACCILHIEIETSNVDVDVRCLLLVVQRPCMNVIYMNKGRGLCKHTAPWSVVFVRVRVKLACACAC